MISIIFDMDGTLLDTQGICVPAWEWAGKNQGIFGCGEYVKFVVGKNEETVRAYIAKTFPSFDIDRFRKDSKDYSEKFGSKDYKKGALELLEYLKNRGIKMAIASGSTTEVVNKLMTNVGGLGYFEALVGGEETVNCKPHPEVFLKAAERLGVSPEDCIVFEDSPYGIEAAVRAGMRVIGIPDIVSFDDETKSKCFKVLNSLDEAIDIFEKLL